MCICEGHGSVVLGLSLLFSFHPQSTPWAVAGRAGVGSVSVSSFPIPPSSLAFHLWNVAGSRELCGMAWALYSILQLLITDKLLRAHNLLSSKGVTLVAATPNADGSAQGPSNPSTYTD